MKLVCPIVSHAISIIWVSKPSRELLMDTNLDVFDRAIEQLKLCLSRKDNRGGAKAWGS